MWTILSVRLLSATAFFLAYPSAALNDDFWPLPEAIQARARRPSRGPDVSGRIEIVGRISGISGDLEPGMNLGYEDLFGTGSGVSLEGSIEVKSGEWDLGGYLSIGWDSFPGKRNTDDFGDSLKPDTMEIITVVVGFKAFYDFGQGFYVDSHIGLGAALYRPVDGTLTLSGVPMQVEVFKSSATVVLDIGFRFGYSVDPVFFDLGLGVRVQGPPRNGDLDFDSSGPAILAFEFGVGLKF